MTLKINVASVWKEPTTKINVAGVWKVPGSTKINVAGTWKTIGKIAQFNTNGDVNSRFSPGTVYAGLQINSNGTEYEYTNAGGTTSIGTWLKSGLNSAVWVQCTVHSGSWNSINPGTGRLQCNTTRSYRLVRSTNGTHSCTCTFNFYDAATGGNLIDTTGSIIFSAVVDAL